MPIMNELKIRPDDPYKIEKQICNLSIRRLNKIFRSQMAITHNKLKTIQSKYNKKYNGSNGYAWDQGQEIAKATIPLLKTMQAEYLKFVYNMERIRKTAKGVEHIPGISRKVKLAKKRYVHLFKTIKGQERAAVYSQADWERDRKKANVNSND
jgi:hypothetical protein